MSARTEWTRRFPELGRAVKKSASAEEARNKLDAFVQERRTRLRGDPRRRTTALEYYAAMACAEALRRILSPHNEALAGHSAAGAIWKSLRRRHDTPGEAFWQEILHLFMGADGKSRLYAGVEAPRFLKLSGRDAATARNEDLNALGERVHAQMARYRSGLEPSVMDRRRDNRARVLDALDGRPSDWDRPDWQLTHIIRDADTLGRMIELTEEERAAITLAREHGLPFAITPYYVSLMDFRAGRERDHAVRAQVIPPMDYVQGMIRARQQEPESLDFMGEADTSPVDLVTRRYPQIAIFKPFNTCAQICVYCQRNWEIRDAMEPGALAPADQRRRAIEWFRRQESLEEVLITGGDPLMLSDNRLAEILREFADMPHIRRIRIGTRAPVVLPMRFTRSLLHILRGVHRDRCQILIVTHVEHPYEVTPDVRAAVGMLRRLGMSVYNQQVFTIENSRRFETAALRRSLKEIGIDPYYTFNAKGKEETGYYRVPIARLLQERKEEARLTPGDVRTDEPVFNLPRLGKNHLRAGQDHHVIGLAPDGGRIYEFLPWEKNLYPSPSYVYHDVPIYDYLQRLAARGENTEEYGNIWYYF